MKRRYEEVSLPFGEAVLQAFTIKQTRFGVQPDPFQAVYNFDVEPMDESEDVPEESEWVYDEKNGIMRNDVPMIEELE